MEACGGGVDGGSYVLTVGSAVLSRRGVCVCVSERECLSVRECAFLCVCLCLCVYARLQVRLLLVHVCVPE